jgi:hypothetical protein
MTQKNTKPIPDKFFTLFGDYDPESIDVSLHKELIIGRIAEIESWDWMISHV